MRALVLLVLLAFTTTAHADRRRDRPTGDRREAVKKKIRALRAYTLTEELGLDAALAGRVFPILAKWDDVTDKLLVQRVELTRQMSATTASTNPKLLDKLIDDSVTNQRAMWDLEDKRLAELRKILSPVQTAKLLVVLPQFERRIQNQLRRAIQKARGGSPPPVDDDDDSE
jgi:hypothetical protein